LGGRTSPASPPRAQGLSTTGRGSNLVGHRPAGRALPFADQGFTDSAHSVNGRLGPLTAASCRRASGQDGRVAIYQRSSLDLGGRQGNLGPPPPRASPPPHASAYLFCRPHRSRKVWGPLPRDLIGGASPAASLPPGDAARVARRGALPQAADRGARPR